MTKKTTLAIIALLGFTATQAQLYIGANAGIHNTKLYNVSDAKADERQDYVMTLKPQFGITVGYQVNDKLSLELQPQLFTLGQKYKGIATDFVNNYTMDASVNLQYAKLPVFLKYTFSKPYTKLSYHILAGVSVAYLANYTADIYFANGPNLANNFLISTDVKIKNNSFDIIETRKVAGQNVAQTSNSILDKGIYDKLNIAMNLGLGFNLAISEKLRVNGNILVDYGMLNMESTDSINIVDAASNTNVDLWHTGSFKHCIYHAAPKSTDTKRNTFTNGRALGIQLGVTYILGNKNANLPKKM